MIRENREMPCAYQKVRTRANAARQRRPTGMRVRRRAVAHVQMRAPRRDGTTARAAPPPVQSSVAREGIHAALLRRPVVPIKENESWWDGDNHPATGGECQRARLRGGGGR